MLQQALKSSFVGDLKSLKKEIESYQDEAKIWYIEKGIANSAGNLCLHLIGNLNTYIGAEFGKTGYIRHRDLEFSLKDIPRTELLEKIDQTILVIEKALDAVTDEQLQSEYPTQMTTTESFLVHLATHLTYHLGQINYHRRLLDV